MLQPHSLSPLTRMNFPAGVQTDFGTLLPPAMNLACYVRSIGPQSLDNKAVTDKMVRRLEDALPRCRPGQGDVIIVLPGHDQEVTDALMFAALRAGTRIIGVGTGDLMPTFRWTATGARWDINQAACQISGLRLRMEGANGVVNAINVTAPGFELSGCDIELASGATAKATVGITIGSGAHRASVIGNRFRGTETHNVTDGILIAGATPPSDVTIGGNQMIASATAGNGLVRVSVAAKRLNITGNTIYNTHTSSTAAIAFGDVASDGVCQLNSVGVLVAAADPEAVGLVFTSTGSLVRCYGNLVTHVARRSGVTSPEPVGDTT